MTKLTYQDFRTALDKSSSKTFGNPDTAYFLMGALESIIADLGADLSKAKQKSLMDTLDHLAIRIAGRVGN